jgi:hypothetical protein
MNERGQMKRKTDKKLIPQLLIGRSLDLIAELCPHTFMIICPYEMQAVRS